MNQKPPQNSDLPFDLELVDTLNLVAELTRRSECIVLGYTRTSNTNNADFHALVHGNLFTCRGLADYLAEHCIDELSDGEEETEEDFLDEES